MSHQERRNSIDSFENEGQFLVSTEAGGEGINLQRYCHTMVNVDLPWNPMRIAQRIGRLYRYGQKKKVVVFNLHVPQSLDASILETMYFKLDQIVADLASVGGEYHEGMKVSANFVPNEDLETGKQIEVKTIITLLTFFLTDKTATNKRYM